MNEHILTVSRIHRNEKQLPLIRLSGQHLRQCGFQIGSKLQVRLQPGRITIELLTPERTGTNEIAGFIMLQHQGRYAIYNRELFHELQRDDAVAVDLGDDVWVTLKVAKDKEGYYLTNHDISFYPKMVYGRLIIPGQTDAGS